MLKIKAQRAKETAGTTEEFIGDYEALKNSDNVKSYIKLICQQVKQKLKKEKGKTND